VITRRPLAQLVPLIQRKQPSVCPDQTLLHILPGDWISGFHFVFIQRGQATWRHFVAIQIRALALPVFIVVLTSSVSQICTCNLLSSAGSVRRAVRICLRFVCADVVRQQSVRHTCASLDHISRAVDFGLVFFVLQCDCLLHVIDPLSDDFQSIRLCFSQCVIVACNLLGQVLHHLAESREGFSRRVICEDCSSSCVHLHQARGLEACSLLLDDTL